MEDRDALFFEEIFPWRNKRSRKETLYGSDFLTYMVENEPATYKQVMSSPEAPFWEEV